MRQVPWIIWVVLGGAVLGFVLSAISTADFVAHLDRQVHGIHCSVIPGFGAKDLTGTSGCHVALMSPYSSIFRSALWGGIPIALPSMAVFAFLTLFASWVWLRAKWDSPRITGVLFLASLVPVAASLFMGYLSLVHLGSVCSTCLGIYLASFATGLGAFALWKKSERRAINRVDAPRSHVFAFAVVLGALFVVVPVVVYAAVVPDYGRFAKTCGQLPTTGKEARNGAGSGSTSGSTGSSPAFVELSTQGEVEAIEILDPLCPACRGFIERLHASGYEESLRQSLLLFPLDTECNWMLDESVHPGACAVSKAILCGSEQSRESAQRVLSWAFEEQETLLREGQKSGPKRVAELTAQAFPALRTCIESAKIRNRLNQGLLWAVKNKLPVVTPQLYLDGYRLCDADTDLGLEYMMATFMEQR